MRKGTSHREESKRKISNAFSGEKNNMFGISSSKSPRWNGGGHRYWKEAILKRDNYTCQVCGLQDPEIMVVDHIKPKKLFPELSKDPKNMWTLCANDNLRKTRLDWAEIAAWRRLHRHKKKS